MSQTPQADASNKTPCRRCGGKGFLVKKTNTGSAKMECGLCRGSGRSGYQTK